jgi:hypothetical protein
MTGSQRIRAGLESVRRWCGITRTRQLRRRESLSSLALAAEILEIRSLLSAATAWSQASALTVSFAPDGTQVAGQSSSLFSSMSGLGGPAVWEQAILDAFQTWAIHANLNIGLVSDDGQGFGTGRLSQGDPRFGDIRIAAVPMASDVLAITVPATGSGGGSWTGDILFNSNAQFSNLSDVFAVALHEAGHALGLPDSTDPASPMYANLPSGQVNAPTASDITALDQLYGRAPSERVNNGTLQTATAIPIPTTPVPTTPLPTTPLPTTNYDGSTPLVTYGYLSGSADLDFLALTLPAGYSGSVTFTLRTAGISQLAGNISVFDAQGNLLGQAQSSGSPLQDTALQISPPSGSTQLFVEISTGNAGVDGFGRYALTVRFDAKNVVSEAALSAVARGHYDYSSANQIRQMFLSSLQSAQGTSSGESDDSSDDGGSQNYLHGVAGSGGRRSSATGAISVAQPINTYSIETPEAEDNPASTSVMTATVWADTQGGLLPSITVLDGLGNVVAAQVLANGLGTYTVQVQGVPPSTAYRIQVSAADPSGPYSTGGYSLEVRFGATAVTPAQYATGSLTSAQSQQAFALTVSQTTLFQFGLSTGALAGAPADLSLQMEIFDQSGSLVYQLYGTPGSLRTASALLLNPGSYSVVVSAATSAANFAGALNFAILGNIWSDPIGPGLVNPGAPPLGPPPAPPFNWAAPPPTWIPPPTWTPPPLIDPNLIGWLSGLP